MKTQLQTQSCLGELLNINWNRMSELSEIKYKNEKQKKEISCRISIQNTFACSGRDVSELILRLNDQTKINHKDYLK